MPALQDKTSLWRNVSVNVVENSSWSCVLVSALKVHWRVQPTGARRSGRFNKMHGALRALHVSLINISMWTARKCLIMNNDHLIALRIWMEWRYRAWGATHEAFMKPSSEAQNSFWLKNRTGEDMGHFPQVQLIKLSRVLLVVWQGYVKGDRRHSKHLFLLEKKC